MPVSWVERIVDRPNVVPRLVVLLAVAAGYLTLFQADSPSPRLDWGFALAAVTLGVFGGIWPLFASVAGAILLLVADCFGTFEHGPAAFVKYMAVCSLFELAVRRPGRSVAIGMAVLAGVYTVHTGPDLPGALPSLLYRIVITVAVPALLGAYVRATRTLASQSRRRAEEERRHHAARVHASAIAERTALARELHDLVAHHVSAMVLRVGVARHVLADGDPQITKVLDDLHQSSTAALADLRRLVAVLRDPAQGRPDLEASVDERGGLPAALAAIAKRCQTIGVTVDTSVAPQVTRLDPLRCRTVLRLAQEGLANVARHAGPSAHALLRVHVADSGEVHLRIVDNGRRDRTPSVSKAAPTGAGFGLIGMRERVECLGGRFEAGPIDGGWELTAVLPADGTCQKGAQP